MEGTVRKQTQQAVTEEYIGDHRLWLAVIVRAVEDWRSGTLRVRREAQKFLFEDDKDFNRVCAGAGLEPSSLRASLLKIGHRIAMKGSWANPIAAREGFNMDRIKPFDSLIIPCSERQAFEGNHF